MTTDNTHTRTGDEQIDDPGVHHEESDVDIGAIFMFAAGLTAVAVVVHLLVWGVFVVLDRREAAQAAKEFPLAAGQERRLPPEPRLQEAPRLDLQDLRRTEDATLNGYAIDKATGEVRIPIADAMRLTLQRGLPARAAPPQTAAPGSPQGRGMAQPQVQK